MDRHTRRRRTVGITILSLVGLSIIGIAGILVRHWHAMRQSPPDAQMMPGLPQEATAEQRWTETQRIAARAESLSTQYFESDSERQSEGAEAEPVPGEVDINAGLAPPERLRYRDTIILRRQFGDRACFRVDGSRVTYDSLYEAQMAVNRQALAAAATYFDEELLIRFEAADVSRDAKLEWREIRVFQQDLYSEFSHQVNDVALRPDEFLRLGGGDCEDWALVTCALLRFWGIENLIAIVKDSDAPFSHAITLMRARTAEVRSQAVYLYEEWLDHIPDAEPGLYVPIDYNRVGEASTAVSWDYWYVAVERPEFVYGLRW